MGSLVSVIIPVYNVEKYLNQCLDSIVNQTYKDLEIIIVADLSTDKSTEICEEYAAKDERIVLLQKYHTGPALARNYGYDCAKGDYILFCDSDDYLELQAVEKLVMGIKKDEYDCIFYDAHAFTDDGLPCNENNYIHDYSYEGMTAAEILKKEIVFKDYNPCVYLFLFRHDFLQRIGLRFYDGILGEDELYAFNVYLNAEKMGQHREVLYHRRVRPGSLMTSEGNREKKFVSYLTVYNEMKNTDVQGKEKKKAKNLYVIKMAKSLERMYRIMSEDDRKKHKKEYDDFKKEIIKKRGYGSCSMMVRFYCRPLGIALSKIEGTAQKLKYKIGHKI